MNVNPTFLQNNLIFNDSIEVDINIFNLADAYSLNWLALLEYPENETNPPGEVLQQFNATGLVSPFTDNAVNQSFSSTIISMWLHVPVLAAMLCY